MMRAARAGLHEAYKTVMSTPSVIAEVISASTLPSRWWRAILAVVGVLRIARQNFRAARRSFKERVRRKSPVLLLAAELLESQRLSTKTFFDTRAGRNRERSACTNNGQRALR
jgi:hypothetical protein